MNVFIIDAVLNGFHCSDEYNFLHKILNSFAWSIARLVYLIDIPVSLITMTQNL